MADKINAAGYELKPWWPYVRELMEGGGSVTVEQLNVTENGTYTAEAGKAYSPVVVNVEGGESDFSTATVTISGSGVLFVPALSENQGIEFIDTKLVQTGDVVLYKGNCVAVVDSGTPTVSGSVQDLGGGVAYLITGDCTFSFSIT